MKNALENTSKETLSSLESQYVNLMKSSHVLPLPVWEKKGDVFIQFSVYDTSKYETSLTSSKEIKYAKLE